MRVVIAARCAQVDVVDSAVETADYHGVYTVAIFAVEELLHRTVVDDSPGLSLEVDVHAINSGTNVRKPVLLINLKEKVIRCISLNYITIFHIYAVFRGSR